MRTYCRDCGQWHERQAWHPQKPSRRAMLANWAVIVGEAIFMAALCYAILIVTAAGGQP